MSNDSYLPPLDLPYGFGTQARWATEPNKKLIVFVHGFKGAAASTWGRLPDLVSMHPDAKGYDLVSFGYESVVQTAVESANQLHAFLDELLADSQKVVNRSIVNGYDGDFQRKASWKYDKIVLVGHSLGACVVRRALLNHLRSGSGIWPNKIKLVWFAPAHCGARLFRLWAMVTLGLSVDGLDKVATYFGPVLKDLAEESKFLRQLEDQTEALCGTNPELNSPLTLWAWKDKVVVNDIFAKDKTPFEEIRGVNHVSICKPPTYDKRVDLLLKELK